NLVTGNKWIFALHPLVVDHAEIAVADAAMADFDFDLFVAQRTRIEVESGKLSVRFVSSVGVDHGANWFAQSGTGLQSAVNLGRQPSQIGRDLTRRPSDGWQAVPLFSEFALEGESRYNPRHATCCLVQFDARGSRQLRQQLGI